MRCIPHLTPNYSLPFGIPTGTTYRLGDTFCSGCIRQCLVLSQTKDIMPNALLLQDTQQSQVFVKGLWHRQCSVNEKTPLDQLSSKGASDR